MEKAQRDAACSVRTDGYVNARNNYGTARDPNEHYYFRAESAVPDDALSTFYEGNGLFAKIIDAPAEEAVKNGFTVEGISHKATEDLYRAALDVLKFEEIFSTAIKWARVFGGALAVMLINDGRGIDEPLDWNKIRSIDEIVVYDRSVIQPGEPMLTNVVRDPFKTRARFGMPEYYTVYSKHGTFRVHESRCLIFRNGRLPENCSNANYRFWGAPEYLRIRKAVENVEISNSAGVRMLSRAIQAVYKVKDLSALLATADGEDAVLRRIQAIDLARGLLNTVVIDAEGEDYDFKNFSLSGVGEVISQSFTFLSAVSGIPRKILTGMTATGLKNTDNTSMEVYYNLVERIQTLMVKKNLRYLLAVIFQAGKNRGEIPGIPPIKIRFFSLWSMSALEEAECKVKREQTRLIKAKTAEMYVDMGVITSEEVRKNLAKTQEYNVETMLKKGGSRYGK